MILQETVNQIIVEEGQRLFHKQATGRNEEYERHRQVRHGLLKDRSALKKEIQNIPDDMTEELMQIQQRLTQVTKMLAGIRQSQWRDIQLN